MKYAIVEGKKWLQQDDSAGPPGGNEVGFINILFPEGVQYGTDGGPRWNTQVSDLDSGGEERVQRWPESRRSYNAVHNIKSRDDLSQILILFEAVNGAANGFRFKNWNDFTTALNLRADPSADDVKIGTGDGVETEFQLFKEYKVPGTENKFQRVIKLPLTPAWGHTPLVKVGGVSKTYGVDFTVSDVTGLLMFTVAPALGADITVGFKHHDPVRFGAGSDEQLRIAIDSFDSGSLPDVPLVELVDDIFMPEDFNYGGSSEVDLVAPWQLTPTMGAAIRWYGATNSSAYLFQAPLLPAGFPWHAVTNDTPGAGVLTLRTKLTTIGSLNPGETGILGIWKVGGVNTWRLVK